jgi:hypothetical protein
MGTKVTVYRFTCRIPGHAITPKYMAGTREAIAQLQACVPIEESAREVEAKLLEEGFFFEDAPYNFVPIEDPRFEQREAALHFAHAACGAE